VERNENQLAIDELAFLVFSEKWNEPITIVAGHELQKYSKYKWRFLKRNKRYKKDFEDFMATKINCMAESETDIFSNVVPWSDQYFLKFRNLARKWNIAAPIDPNLSAGSLLSDFVSYFLTEAEKKKIATLTSGKITDEEKLNIVLEHIREPIDKAGNSLYQCLFPDHHSLLPVRVDNEHYILDTEWNPSLDYVFDNFLDPQPNPDVGKNGILNISLDLNYPKKVLLKELDNLIDVWKKKYDWAIGEFYHKKLRQDEPKLDPKQA
jgi:hypothetical protein